VDTQLKAAFLRAAKANDRSASVLIRDFMRQYIKSTQVPQASVAFENSLTLVSETHVSDESRPS